MSMAEFQGVPRDQPDQVSSYHADSDVREGAGPVALEARGLTLSWDAGAHIVARGIDLRVARGEIVCLVGRSGCGKTTLLHALSGLTQPLEGFVYLNGKDITGKPGHLSYMLQKDLLLPHLRVIDNVCLPLTLAGMSKAEARARSDALFDRFGLEGMQSMWPSQLSGGMRQRAAFLRTYLMGNDVVLLDEPFSALDALTRDDLRGWWVRMSAELGISSLVITHDVDEAVLVASRVLVLRGNPRQGRPSSICGEVRIPAHDENFMLSHAFVDCKCAVMELLG